jgi:hypothetical protein
LIDAEDGHRLRRFAESIHGQWRQDRDESNGPGE